MLVPSQRFPAQQAATPPSPKEQKSQLRSHAQRERQGTDWQRPGSRKLKQAAQVPKTSEAEERRTDHATERSMPTRYVAEHQPGESERLVSLPPGKQMQSPLGNPPSHPPKRHVDQPHRADRDQQQAADPNPHPPSRAALCIRRRRRSRNAHISHNQPTFMRLESIRYVNAAQTPCISTRACLCPSASSWLIEIKLSS